MPTFEDMQQAYHELEEGLVKAFNVANGGPIEAIGVDGNKDVGNGEFGLAIILQRKPTDDEQKQLPHEHLGVPINYILRP